jgi:hypothetical protein
MTRADTIRALCEQVRAGDVEAATVLTDVVLESGGELDHDGGVLVRINEGVGRKADPRFALVYRNRAVLLFGVRERWSDEKRACVATGYARLFKLGEAAEHDSYNLSYYGDIRSISTKCVVIAHKHSRRTSRLTLAHFDSRNWDFDRGEAFAKNSEAMVYL